MATSKKPVSKKSTAKPSAARRPSVKVAAKKAPAKRSTTVRKTVKHNEFEVPRSGGKYDSFKVGKAPNFFSFRVTEQTIYWAIVGFMVLALGVWVVTINEKVQYLYDQIDQQNADSLVTKKK